jgi:hypothetical protein
MTNNPWGDNGLMALCAVRYCLGRRTYISYECREWLYDVWPDLPEKAKNLIKRDVDEAFNRDDEDRASGSTQYKALGDDCDRREWEKVRLLWSKN